MGAVGWV